MLDLLEPPTNVQDVADLLADLEQVEAQRQADELTQAWTLYVAGLRASRDGEHLDANELSDLRQAMQRIGKTATDFRSALAALAQRDELKDQLATAQSLAPSADEVARLQRESIAAQNRRRLDTAGADAAVKAYNKVEKLLLAVHSQRSMLTRFEREHAELFERFDATELVNV